jgi:type IV pilus biogenesis/stability protein PilW
MRTLALAVALTLAGCLTPRAMQDAQTHRKMGVALLSEGNAGGAVTEFKAAVKANPWDEEALHELGLAWFAVGKHDEAERCFKKVLQMEPAFSQAKLNYGSLLLAEQRWDEAITVLEPAAEDPEYRERARARHNIGWAWFNKGDMVKSRDSFQQVLRTHPSFCPALHTLAMVSEAEGQQKDALQLYRDAHSCAPKELGTLLSLGTLEGKLDLVPDACAHLKTVATVDPFGPLAGDAKRQLTELRCDGVSTR